MNHLNFKFPANTRLHQREQACSQIDGRFCKTILKLLRREMNRREKERAMRKPWAFRQKRCKKIPDSPHLSNMKRWVSNPLRALHWFGSSSNWLRSTPQSLLEACVTRCHVADSTQGFSISSMLMYSEDKRWCVRQEAGWRSEFLHEFTHTCPAFCCLCNSTRNCSVSQNCFIFFLEQN